MNDCIPTAELAALRELPSDHPRRRHIEACARCRAQWLLYLDFAATDARVIRAEPRSRRSPRRWWPAPLAMAAVLACAVLLTRETVAPNRAPVTVLRGSPVPAGLELEPIQPLPDGALALRWRALAGARGYQVRLLSPAGETLYESAIQPDTAFVLRRDVLPEPAGAEGAVVWRVLAVTEDGVIMSAPAVIERQSRRGM